MRHGTVVLVSRALREGKSLLLTGTKPLSKRSRKNAARLDRSVFEPSAYDDYGFRTRSLIILFFVGNWKNLLNIWRI